MRTSGNEKEKQEYLQVKEMDFIWHIMQFTWQTAREKAHGKAAPLLLSHASHKAHRSDC